MPRETMDREIRNLLDNVLLLGSMVEKSIVDAMRSLKNRDIPLSEAVLLADREVNRLRFEIEKDTLLVIATQQPMAHDLRQLAAILEVAGELERIGDYAKGNAKINTRLSNGVVEVPINELEAMSNITASMLHRAVVAFVKEDLKTARELPEEDDVVDEMYRDIYRKLVQSMILKPAMIDHTNLYIWAAHNLERTSDRVSNICERTIFVVTGEMMEVSSNDQDVG